MTREEARGLRAAIEASSSEGAKESSITWEGSDVTLTNAECRELVDKLHQLAFGRVGTAFHTHVSSEDYQVHLNLWLASED